MALPPWLLQRLQAGGGFMPANYGAVPLPGGGGPMPGAPPAWSTPPFNPNAPNYGAVPLPGGMPPSRVPQPQQPQGGPPSQPLIPTYGKGVPPWLQKFSGGFNKFANGISGVQYNPNLSPQQNEALAQHQRMAMIGSLFQSARPVPRGTGSVLADFGDAMFASQQAGGQRTESLMREQAVQRELEEADRHAQAAASLDSFIQQLASPRSDGSTSLNAEQAKYLSTVAQIDPSAAASMIGKIPGILGPAPEERIGESPIGKLFADLETAEASGNAAAVSALESAIQQEIGGDEDAPEITFDDVRALRNDVKRDSAQFLEQQRGYQAVLAAVKDPSPAGDLALVFGTMKTLDPGSIVREGEVQLTEGAGSLAQRVAADFKRVFSGERLTEGQRQDFVNMAKSQFGAARKQHDRVVEDARGFAERHELGFEDVFPEYLMPQDEGDGPPVPEYDFDPATGQLVPRR